MHLPRHISGYATDCNKQKNLSEQQTGFVTGVVVCDKLKFIFLKVIKRFGKGQINLVSWTALSFSWLSWRLTSKKSFDKTVNSCSNLHDVTCLIFWALSDGNEKNKNLYCSVRKSKENLRLLARQRVNRIETYVTSFMDPLRHFFPHSFIASLQYFFIAQLHSKL